MNHGLKLLSRGSAFLVPVALGIGAFVLLTSSDREVSRTQSTEVARKMRVIDVAAMPMVPRTEGYGLARADRTWRAIAQVGGRIVELHPELRSGSRVQAGALLVKIDTTDVEITIASARAEVARLTGELQQIEQEEINNTRSLKIEQTIVGVLEGEVERLEELLQKDASSRVAYEQSQRTLLAQKQSALGIENSTALLPFQTAITQAQLDGANASLARAERDLEFCTVRSPFVGSVGATTIEVGQYVAPNEELFEVSFDGTLRIDAAIPQDQVFRLLGEAERTAISKMLADQTEEAKDLVDGIFQVRVISKIGSFEREWPAKVVGVRESLDEQTKALLMTVVVEQEPGNRLAADGPPLSPGSFCRVEIQAAPREAIVIPREVLRDGDAFWLDAENRLRRATLDIEFHQGELTVVRSGLEPGVQLVVSDPTPAIEGQLISPIVDGALSAKVAREAAGDGEAQ